MSSQYQVVTTYAHRILVACPRCAGDLLFVVGLSTEWRCVGCGITLEIAHEKKEDPRLDTYREFLETIN